MPSTYSQEENNKSLMRRWYDEMWQPCNFDLIPELTGPHYTRHDMMGTRTVTGEEYRDSLKMFGATWTIRDFNYFLMSEGNFITSIGSWVVENFDGQGAEAQWDWVQSFRVEDDRLVETWLPAMGGTDTQWAASDIPAQNILVRG